MTVTGRTYRRTRPRGFAPWSPSPATAELLAEVGSTLEELSGWWPLTARQLFYRLVAGEVVGKTERDYARLLEVLNRARRAGLVPWEAVRDDGTTALVPWAETSVESFRLGVANEVRTYRLDRQAGQRRRIEVWVESAGMARQLARSVADHSVPVYSSGGFTSTTARYDAARRAAEDPWHRPTVILNVGDWDPSGCSVVDSFAEDLNALAIGLGAIGGIEVVRVAITPDQAEEYGAPSAPQKATDRRGEQMAETWQAEALAPGELAGIVRATVEDLTDPAARRAVLDREAADRAELEDWLRR